ncbi:hypothetical protein Droror1_Dr00018007 [Drosera rotundifolia]
MPFSAQLHQTLLFPDLLTAAPHRPCAPMNSLITPLPNLLHPRHPRFPHQAWRPQTPPCSLSSPNSLLLRRAACVDVVTSFAVENARGGVDDGAGASADSSCSDIPPVVVVSITAAGDSTAVDSAAGSSAAGIGWSVVPPVFQPYLQFPFVVVVVARTLDGVDGCSASISTSSIPAVEIRMIAVVYVSDAVALIVKEVVVDALRGTD